MRSPAFASTISQDQANDLATLVKARNHERVCAQGIMLACVGNGKPVDGTILAPYLTAFNDATKALYRALWTLHEAGHGPRPGKAPVMRYSDTVRCDTRCTHATGAECVCSCGGINHATFFAGQFVGSPDAAAQVKRVRDDNAAELKALNADPVRRMLHLFGVKAHKEAVASAHALDALAAEQASRRSRY